MFFRLLVFCHRGQKNIVKKALLSWGSGYINFFQTVIALPVNAFWGGTCFGGMHESLCPLFFVRAFFINSAKIAFAAASILSAKKYK